MGYLGLLQCGDSLFPQHSRHPGAEPQTGLVLRVAQGIQPHPAVGLSRIHHPWLGGDEGHAQLRDQQLLPARAGPQRAVPGDAVPAPGRRAAARCIVHPALVEELRELAGPGNVAVTEEKTR